MSFQSFKEEQTGAVTVDWVVLTASLVGLGLAVMAVVSGGVEDLSSDIEDQFKTSSIITSSFVTSEGDSPAPLPEGVVSTALRGNLYSIACENGGSVDTSQSIADQPCRPNMLGRMTTYTMDDGSIYGIRPVDHYAFVAYEHPTSGQFQQTTFEYFDFTANPNGQGVAIDASEVPTQLVALEADHELWEADDILGIN